MRYTDNRESADQMQFNVASKEWCYGYSKLIEQLYLEKNNTISQSKLFKKNSIKIQIDFKSSIDMN